MTDKQTLRRHYKTQRQAISAERRLLAGQAIIERVLPLIEQALPQSQQATHRNIVAGYYPQDDEFDILPLLHHLQKTPFEPVLPIVTGRDQPLAFGRWPTAPEVFRRGAYGIFEPPVVDSSLSPYLFLVPLLAFDLKGYRLGYGGGYYDRTLAQARHAHPVTAIGIGFELQRHTGLPYDPTDQRLDYIVTESSVYDCRMS